MSRSMLRRVLKPQDTDEEMERAYCFIFLCPCIWFLGLGCEGCCKCLSGSIPNKCTHLGKSCFGRVEEGPGGGASGGISYRRCCGVRFHPKSSASMSIEDSGIIRQVQLQPQEKEKMQIMKESKVPPRA